MNEELFADLIGKIKIGKQLPDAIYLHKDAFSALPSVLNQFIPAVAKAVSLDDESWNLVKLFKKEFRLSLLHYPDFYTDSYPALRQSLNVDLSKLSHKITSYKDADNPPHFAPKRNDDFARERTLRTLYNTDTRRRKRGTI
ncbi:methyltransferase [Vibrio sp. B1FLJ16]|nr:methyltransferase [Vibrio sp. B1FLJ16]CAE6905911.1 methyltransferase [Vibrio sp. B1FLJ16]